MAVARRFEVQSEGHAPRSIFAAARYKIPHPSPSVHTSSRQPLAVLLSASLSSILRQQQWPTTAPPLTALAAAADRKSVV